MWKKEIKSITVKFVLTKKKKKQCKKKPEQPTFPQKSIVYFQNIARAFPFVTIYCFYQIVELTGGEKRVIRMHYRMHFWFTYCKYHISAHKDIA